MRTLSLGRTDTPGVGSRHGVAGAERTQYSALQTACAHTLSAKHRIISAHDTTLADMPPATQLD